MNLNEEQREDPKARIELRIYPYDTGYKWEIREHHSNTGVTTIKGDGKTWADLVSVLGTARQAFDEYVRAGSWSKS